jgi:ribonuclease D
MSNPFNGDLKRILEHTRIVKVFHDFCEDASALVNQFGVSPKRVYDT